MLKNINKNLVGFTLLFIAVGLYVVGLRALTAIQSAMIKAYMTDGVGGPVSEMVIAWPELLLPLVVTISTASFVIVVAALLSFRGKLTVSYTAKSKEENPV